ncbi:MAG: PilZ domain-containing protein [Methylococcales bacterium]|nr:PilZ domain-containing protein [Methylococcales bacterium]MBT7576786.1 PilZ domain-containing protein [Methylococcales bacterium]
MSKRCERISFDTVGYILVGNEELSISVVNISLTGFLANIEPTVLMPTVRELFQGISEHKFIEFNLVELNISGICTTVWSKTVEGRFLTGFEFYDSKYDSSVMKSKRRFYRSGRTLTGVIEHKGLNYNFTTTNTSHLGMMALVNGSAEFNKNDKVQFEITGKKMFGIAKVVWFKYDVQGVNALAGLEFVTVSNV